MTSTFLGTFALVFAAMLGLYAFDTLLAKMEQAESRAEAQRLFDQGKALLGHGDTANAVERFRRALSFSRKNTEYQLALARALLAAGKLDDAEQVSRNLLEENPTDGAANLTMGRLLRRKGRLADAESFYHRAIYGRWPTEDAAKQRLQVRMELVDLLAWHDDKEALLAELLALQDEKFDSGTRERIAHLYLQAGSAIHTCQLCNTNSFEYLMELQRHARELAANPAEWMPWNYRDALAHAPPVA